MDRSIFDHGGWDHVWQDTSARYCAHCRSWRYTENCPNCDRKHSCKNCGNELRCPTCDELDVQVECEPEGVV